MATSTINAKSSNQLSMELKSITSQANQNKSVKAAQILAVKDEVVKTGMGEVKLANGQSVSSVLDDMAKMASAQEAGKPLQGSDKAWAEDVAALNEVAEFAASTAGGIDALNNTTTGINAAAGDGSSDAATVKDLHDKAYGNNGATKTNVTGDAATAYQKAVSDPNVSPADLGKAQRNLMLAFQVQYPEAKPAEFQTYMGGVLGGVTDADPTRKSAATNAAAAASYSDIAAATH